MTRQTDGKSLYEQQEERILAQSDAFISLLTKRGILGDHQIDNEKVRKAKQEKNRKSYHNTQLLLQHYRNIAWLLECLPVDVAAELDEPFEGVDKLIDQMDLEIALGNRKLENRMEGIVSICLCVVFLIVLIVELPGIRINRALGLDGSQPTEQVTIVTVFETVTDVISNIIGLGYDSSMTQVETLIADGGYDYDLSMNALVNHAQSSAGYDVAYIMSAYSTSVDQLSATQTDLEAKLSGVSGNMFPVTSVEKENEVITPVTYYTYKPVTMTVVTRIVQTGTINGVPQYRYETDEKTYYVQDEEKASGVSIEVDAYTAVTVTLPVYSGGSISGTRTATYYQSAGKQTLTPTKEIVKYLECTIHPFDNTVISSAFGLDLNAEYSQFGTTYGQVIDSRAQALKMTLYGTASNGSAVPLTDTELIAFLARQNCSETRKHIVKTGLSLVGKVPYFWGGKSAAGWNDEWNTPKLVTAAGSTTSGTIRPFGLDCSGFTDWTYKTAVGVSLYGGTWSQWDESYAITADELLPGDLGFLMDSDGQGWNHVLIFAGYGENGERMWVHSSGGEGVILNTPSYEASLSLRRPKNINFEDSSVIPDVE